MSEEHTNIFTKMIVKRLKFHTMEANRQS